ncbi:DUF1446 domain-containing protein [Aromatoleum toluclasticum]|uniref:acyclic terpene utilization AtuA family protein n=1 Tax=Aromatoleum toluclasticum TaxID=92003 RepID=UPI001D17F9D3|nr:acyclic terpene utilization AtuA family protein [Aromatoleum toluclasticum]MCC4113941.1 DUF1446 domain-containing protein [Aromatoleum toluclasticum]
MNQGLTSHASIRIGAGAGFWGDSTEGPKQLVESGNIDYLMFDYLAEITMSILARNRAKDAKLGYATDFPDVIASLAPQIHAQGIKVISNAGGVNPVACCEALQAKLRAQGLDLRIAIVTGDDLLEHAGTLRATGVREMFSDTPFPNQPLSINAYLGAFPIASALAAGADIVITGRCVDSALALGPLIHEFGWKPSDLDLLAAGSLAGHVIECGCQATGGVSTDWREVCDDWDNMAFPIAECYPDGRFVVTLPEGTGGRVTPETVAEQIVYEIGDPAAYLLPDVTCDLSQVQVRQTGPNRVEVSGSRGQPPSPRYKVSATWQDGYRSTGTMLIGGRDAPDKARKVGEALLKRTRRLMATRGFGDYRRTSIEVLGAESNWGANARARTREVVLKVALHHDKKEALESFSREFFASATSMAQGITGFLGGRPAITPVVRLFSFLMPKADVPVSVTLDGQQWDVPAASSSHAKGVPASAGVKPPYPAPVATDGECVEVPLIAIAYGRSGDKGDHANVGILARRPEFLPVLREVLTANAVAAWFAHFLQGEVTRYELPGLNGFNFLLTRVLDGGGIASLRHDSQGKMFAQILMDFPVSVPREWVDEEGRHSRAANQGRPHMETAS